MRRDDFQICLDQLFVVARAAARLPLQEFLDDFSRAETIGPITDPTLYRAYLYDPHRRGEMIKAIAGKALALKREVERWRETEASTGPVVGGRAAP